MADQVKLPGVGGVDKKKAAVIGLVAAIGIVGIIAVRKKSAGTAAASSTAATTPDPTIDPATGVPYSVEQGQGGSGYAYNSALEGGGVSTGYGSYGGAYTPTAPANPLATTTGITTNQDWITEAESGAIPGNQSTIAAAVVKVMAGLSVTSAQRDLFLECVGVLGNPPGGYPQPIKLSDTSSQPKPVHTRTVEANGSQDVSQIAHENHTTGGELLILNPGLSKFYPGTKHVSKGYKIKVP